MTMLPDNPTQDVESVFDQRFTAILVVLSGYTALAANVLWWFEWLPTVVRIPLALPILLFTPGYTVITALVPTSAKPPAKPDADLAATNSYLPDGISLFERITLAVVISIALVPMVALVVNAVAGLNVGLILIGISLVTAGAAVIAVYRRPTTRTHAYTGAATNTSIWENVPTDRITLGAVVIALLLVGTSAAVSMTGSGSQSMTEFYVGSTNENGTFVASGYPQSFDVGEEKPYTLKIRSHEDDPQQYEIVGLLVSEDGQSVTELGRTTANVQPGEIATVQYPVAPTQKEENLTVQFLLYQGEAPQDVTAETAHRVLEISVTVGDSTVDTDSTETLIVSPVEDIRDNGVTI
ncbi:DUF1616 domain-containing protein [Haloferax sp. DFSO60]|uniref:DUF1616 domain-containing protein n=1 Tax=Haloferax sp. DFSO60 TaxID=3388652 RepID=UPI00397D29D2